MKSIGIKGKVRDFKGMIKGMIPFLLGEGRHIRVTYAEWKTYDKTGVS